MRRLLAALVFAAVAIPVAAIDITLPNKNGSMKVAVIGDMGTGDKGQYAVAAQLVAAHNVFPFDTVLTVGDNMYGGEDPDDFVRKFEQPYKPLLDAGVKFYAALGNHDDRELQRKYKYFNMGGEYYYTFKLPRQGVRVFALESSYMDSRQLQWLEQQLSTSNDPWKIVIMHHPLYSTGKAHGPSLSLRQVLEPLLVKYGVSVVFAGHEHFYERITPQQGIQYFIEGGSGQLRKGNINRDPRYEAKGFDTAHSFMLVEFDGDTMYFEALSEDGTTVDQGSVTRRTVERAPLQRGQQREFTAENAEIAKKLTLKAPRSLRSLR